MSLLPGEETAYLSSDSLCPAEGFSELDEGLYTPEFLNSPRCSGLPNHLLKLKVGVPVIFL